MLYFLFRKKKILIPFAFLFLLCHFSSAQNIEEADTLSIPTLKTVHPGVFKVGVHISPPFVMKREGKFIGMAIDLWETIAKNQGLKYEYAEYDSSGELLSVAAKNEIDIAVSNLTITEDRALLVGFTQPWYQGGLRLMTRSHYDGGSKSIIRGLYNAGYFKLYGILALIVIVGGVIVTFVDRRFDPNFPKGWKKGLAEGFYDMMAITTEGKVEGHKNYFGWPGRIWQGLLMGFAMLIFATITSTVASVMTKIELQSQIQTLNDVGEQLVGVRDNREAEDFALDYNLNYKSYPDLTEAIEALKKKEVRVILGDGPVLRYYVKQHPNDEVKVVGGNITKDLYGFAVPLHSGLERPLTLAILAELDSGYVRELKKKYLLTNP